MKNLVRSGIKAAYNPIQPNISVWSKNNPHLLRRRKFKVLPGILKETAKPARKKNDQIIVRYEVYRLQCVSLENSLLFTTCHVMESVTDEPPIVTNTNVWKSCLFDKKMEVIEERFVDIWVTTITLLWQPWEISDKKFQFGYCWWFHG